MKSNLFPSENILLVSRLIDIIFKIILKEDNEITREIKNNILSSKYIEYYLEA